MHRKLFSVCKTLGLSNSRVESWEKLCVRKTKVGSVLRRSRWDSAAVFAPGGSSSLCGSHAGRISRGEWAENRERVKSILLPSSCIRTLCTVVQASCPPDKTVQSILPPYRQYQYQYRPVYGHCALWCRQVAHQTKQSILPQYICSAVSGTKSYLSIPLPNPPSPRLIPT